MCTGLSLDALAEHVDSKLATSQLVLTAGDVDLSLCFWHACAAEPCTLTFPCGSPTQATGLSLDALAERVGAKLATSEWFVTGDVDPSLFSDAFAFQDESVATTGIKSYAYGVRKLFDQVGVRRVGVRVVVEVRVRVGLGGDDRDRSA